jgi:hypothetical protein
MATTAQCDKKTRLVLECERATQVFSAAVSQLARRTGIVAKTEYDELRHLADRTRLASMNAREELNDHVGEHGC